MRGSLQNSVSSSLSSRADSLEHRTRANVALGNIEVVSVHVEVVLCVCDRALEELLEIFARRLRGVLQDCHCEVNGLVSDEVQNDLNLAGRNSGILQNCFCFHLILSFLLAAGLGTGVTLEGAGRGELAELVTDHIFCHVNRNVLAAVMDGDCVTDEIREDHGSAAPCLDDLLFAVLIHCLNPFKQCGLTKRTLF